MATAPTMLSFELCSTDKLDLGEKLREYIISHHDTVSPDEFTETFAILNKLREGVRQAEVANEGSLEKTLKYQAHLALLGPRFPFGEAGLSDVSFVWRDPFRGSRASSSALAFERACVLFNAAALAGSLGTACNRTGVEGIKAACAHFSSAAGVFVYLREHVVAELDAPVPPQFTPEALKLGEKLYLAQAQENVFEKAVKDGMKDGILAKLAQAAADFYEAALGAISSTVLDGQFHASWKNHLQMRAWVFCAYAQYHAGLAQGAAGEYGIEIGHLDKALGYVGTKAMGKLLRGVPADIADMVHKLKAVLEARLREANHDNDKIYCEVVPSASSLPAVVGKALVRAKAVPSASDMELPDLFVRLVPLHVYTQVSRYTQQVEELVRRVAGSADEASDVANSMLASLNLPAAIEALDAPAGVPPALASKASTMRAEGGLEELASMMETRRMLSGMNSDIVRDVASVLDEEENGDNAMRAQFGVRWNRTPSRTLTTKLREEIAKFKSTLDQAKRADATVEAKYEQSSPHMGTLALPSSQLAAMIPAASDPELVASPTVRSLLGALVKIDALLKERNAVRDAMKAAAEADDITPRLIAEGDVLTPDEIIDQELAKYASYEADVASSIAAQPPMLVEIQALNTEFTQSRSASVEQQQRESLLSALDLAFKHFVEVKANTTEGIAFHTKLQDHLLTLQSRANDFVAAREVEKGDMLRYFQSQATGVQPHAPPAAHAAPAHPPGGWHAAPAAASAPAAFSAPPPASAPPAYDSPYASAPPGAPPGAPPPSFGG